MMPSSATRFTRDHVQPAREMGGTSRNKLYTDRMGTSETSKTRTCAAVTILKDDQERDDRDVTGLLIKWRQGDKAALDALIPWSGAPASFGGT
jgi:hypothetical protein